LARVVYTLSGRLPGEPETQIMQFRIVVSADTANPTWKVQAGDVDEEAIPRYTSHLNQLMTALGQ
jgi:hypothetical protein